MKYRCVAASPEGLVQQVATSYLRHGYWFYVTGFAKAGVDLDALDRKLIAKYGIDVGERERTSRKRRGLANMQYIRYRNWFLLLATEGHHPFKQVERKVIQDCRRIPIKFEGYSVSYRQSGVTPEGGGPRTWHPSVRIDDATYKELKGFFLDRACHRSVENLSKDFARVPYARYAKVRRQLLDILRTVNEARARTGYEAVPHQALRLRRAIVKPFGEPETPADAAEVPSRSRCARPERPRSGAGY